MPLCHQDALKVSPNLPAGKADEVHCKIQRGQSCLVLEFELWTELGCDKVLRFGGPVPVQTPNVSADVHSI